MRYKILFILSFFYCTIGFSQIDVYSNYVKKSLPDRYEMIREYANDKWNMDSAILFEIDKQSEGYIKTMGLMSDHWDCPHHKTIIIMEMNKQSTDKYEYSDADWWKIYQNIKNKMN